MQAGLFEGGISMPAGRIEGKVSMPAGRIEVGTSTPAPPLTAQERTRVAEIRAAVLKIIPDAVALLQSLHREGMIDGWRAVTYVGPLRETPGAYCGPVLHGDEHYKDYPKDK
jgi:hypothetical protein